jgi:hypothetical protein
MRAWRSWRALSATERRLLIVAGVAVTLARLGLWLLPFRLLLQCAERIPARLTGVTAEQAAWAVSVPSSIVPRATCLTQALAALALLHLYGHPATIHIGVRRDEHAQLNAHAWVESGDAVVVGGPHTELAEFVRLERRA